MWAYTVTYRGGGAVEVIADGHRLDRSGSMYSEGISLILYDDEDEIAIFPPGAWVSMTRLPMPATADLLAA